MESTLVTPLAPALESIGHAGAALSRLVYGSGLLQALRAWLPGLCIQPRVAGAAAAAADEPAHFTVTLRGPSSELALHLPWDIDAVSASILNAGSWSPAVQLACLCARADNALAGLLGWLGRLDLHPVRLDSHRRAAAPPADATTFTCSLGRHRFEASLSCSDTAWPARAARQLARQAPAALAAARGVALPVCVLLGQRRMPLRLLGSLQVGDVLVLQRTGGAGGGIDDATLVIGRRGRGALGWPCRVHDRLITATGDKWMNTETLDTKARRLEDAEPAAATPDRGTGRNAMAELEVDLHIELQVLSTPLGELAAMQPGYVLELPVPAAEACVDLVVGGQLYGRAQLVRVGDRLGARILEVFHDDA
jgi:type III secretion protein Q